MADVVEMKRCMRCWAPVVADAADCPSCGSKVLLRQALPSEPSAGAAEAVPPTLPSVPEATGAPVPASASLSPAGDGPPKPKRVEVRLCSQCRDFIDLEATECPRCGAKQRPRPATPQPAAPGAAVASVAPLVLPPMAPPAPAAPPSLAGVEAPPKPKRVEVRLCSQCREFIDLEATECTRCGAKQRPRLAPPPVTPVATQEPAVPAVLAPADAPVSATSTAPAGVEAPPKPKRVEVRLCSQCREFIDLEATECARCGAKQRPRPVPPTVVPIPALEAAAACRPRAGRSAGLADFPCACGIGGATQAQARGSTAVLAVPRVHRSRGTLLHPLRHETAPAACGVAGACSAERRGRARGPARDPAGRTAGHGCSAFACGSRGASQAQAHRSAALLAVP